MKESNSYGLIGWFTKNPVAANLLMLFIIVAGAISASTISKDMFPRTDRNIVQVSAVYPGAAPVEVEKGVILPIESALQGLSGIKEMRSKASRDVASIELDIEPSQDINEVMARIEDRISSILNFPDDLEKPSVSKFEDISWVTGVAVSGPLDEFQRKELGQEIRDELLELSQVKKVILWGVDDYEISIEVKEQRLRELNMTLAEVAKVVRESSLDLPAGMIRSDSGNILVRTEGKAYSGEQFENLVLRSYADGSQLLISDVATVRDTFQESSTFVHFDKESAVTLGIFSLEDQNLLAIDEAVKSYIEKKSETLVDGLTIEQFEPLSFHLRGRLDMMLSNLAMGAILVAVVLTLFLNVQVGFWVLLGIPVSFLGAFWLMPINPYPVTVNVLSLFAFIMVLGIVVDDAIVIGESIYTEAQQKAAKVLGNDKNGVFTARIEDVIEGAKKVAIPSTIGVLTTMAAFAPMLFIGGVVAGFQEAIAVVVILCLIFSLIESKLILPAHLVGMKIGGVSQSRFKFIGKMQAQVDKALKHFIANKYQPALAYCLKRRYLTVSFFLGLLIIAGGAVNSGIAKFEFFPNVPSDTVRAEVIVYDGTSASSMADILTTIEGAAYRVDESYRQQYPEGKGLVKHLLFYAGSDTSGTFIVSLVPSEDRLISSLTFEKLWREEVGQLPNVRKQRYFASTNAGGGAKINFQLSGSNPEQLLQASDRLQNKLAQYNGVFDIYNSQGTGGREIQISLKPYASQIGISLADVGRQVRQAFYGEEVQRIQRGVDRVKVMVRYPKDERDSVASLENLLIRTKSGQAIQIGQVADIKLGQGLSTISRTDRKRTVDVTADVDSSKVQTGTVVSDITDNFIPKLLEQYPEVEFDLGGSTKEENTLIMRTMIGFAAALFLIYGLLAVPLRSYVQPLVIMSVIPFGFIGAVIGHILFGISLNMLSILGLVALAGVVVNDSLILVEFINRRQGAGETMDDSIMSAGKQRFRAIVLTTLTTFVGLLPMLFETSMQAQFVIPMAISLSFGIVFATTMTLILVPCCYRIVYDLKASIQSMRQRLDIGS
ncbi:efflux RND transporter permease subunit [Porticoccaceae bacterium]|nr:efflux RND transporter permease subunit [bacterium]MDB3925532.1 efflux RND transporter permease subunit [Porticoccaceae bacterium]